TPTFMLTATGFGLIVYAAFVWLCDAGTFRLGVLRTLGQNPLIAYLLDGLIGGLVPDFWPESGGWPWALAGAAVRFGRASVPVWLCLCARSAAGMTENLSALVTRRKRLTITLVQRVSK